MLTHMILTLVLSLAITAAAELALGYLCILLLCRKKKQSRPASSPDTPFKKRADGSSGAIFREAAPVILLVNLMTNPPYVMTVLILQVFTPPRTLLVVRLLLEVLIVFAEGTLYKKNLADFPHPYLFSLAANLTSVAAGILLQTALTA